MEEATPGSWPDPCHSLAVASVFTSLRLLFSFPPHLEKWAPWLNITVILCLIWLWRPERAGACRTRGTVVGDRGLVSISRADDRCDFQGKCAEKQSSVAQGWRRVSGGPAFRPEAKA